MSKLRIEIFDWGVWQVWQEITWDNAADQNAAYKSYYEAKARFEKNHKVRLVEIRTLEETG